MAVRAISDKVHKKLKSLRVLAIILFVVGIGFACLIPSAMDGNAVVNDSLFWLAFFGVFIFIQAPLIPWSWRTAYNRYAKTVGHNLKYSFDAQGIQLHDRAENMDIEKSYKWQDVKYVQLQRYTLNRNKGTYLTGLLFVTDEDTFHKALQQRKRKPSFEQRSMELDGGFFVIADISKVIEMANLWGGHVR